MAHNVKVGGAIALYVIGTALIILAIVLYV